MITSRVRNGKGYRIIFLDKATKSGLVIETSEDEDEARSGESLKNSPMKFHAIGQEKK